MLILNFKNQVLFLSSSLLFIKFSMVYKLSLDKLRHSGRVTKTNETIHRRTSHAILK